MKKRINLTESDLNKIVKQSVSKVLKEGYEEPSDIQQKLIDYCMPKFVKILSKYPNIEVETDGDTAIYAQNESGYGIIIKFEYSMF